MMVRWYVLIMKITVFKASFTCHRGLIGPLGLAWIRKFPATQNCVCYVTFGRMLRLRTTCLISLKGWSRLCSGTSTRRRVAVRSFAHMLRSVAVPLSCRCWSMRYDAIDFIMMFHKFFLGGTCVTCLYNIFVLPLGLGSPGNVWLWLSKFKIIEASAYMFAYLHDLPAQVGLADGIALLHAQAGNCMCYI